MPNTFVDNRDRWLLLSEVDYLGQFVKAWLAFNAWYRSAYTETQDRKIINEFKWQSNPVMNHLRPCLENPGTAESEQFRNEIGLLHDRLQNYELQVGKGGARTRISLDAVYLRDNPPVLRNQNCQGYSFAVERTAGGQMRIEAKNRSSMVVLSHSQPRYDLADLEAQPGFTSNLSTNLQGFLRSIYISEEMKPQLIANLTLGSDPPIQCGSYRYQCGTASLFAGIVESVYLMRCSLFHGELVPTKDAHGCYEPAYRLVRRFLDCIV